MTLLFTQQGQIPEATLRIAHQAFQEPLQMLQQLRDRSWGEPIEGILQTQAQLSARHTNPVQRIVRLFLDTHILDHQTPALLVLDGGRPRTVVARADLLSFLSLDAPEGVGGTAR